MRKIVLSPKASSGAESIGMYISLRFSEEVARVYANGLDTMFQYLSQQPAGYPALDNQKLPGLHISVHIKDVLLSSTDLQTIR